MSKVAEKLQIIQKELIAPKNQYNGFGKYNYRSCEDILLGLKPCLEKTKCVVTLSDDVVLVGERYYIKATATLTDAETSESISCTAFAREEDAKKGMDASQVSGSTSSYARKYALNALFAIDDCKDADTRDNSNKEARETEKKVAEATKKKITDVKITILENKCKEDNVSVEKLVKAFGVSSISDLTEPQFNNAIKGWDKVKEKCSND